MTRNEELLAILDGRADGPLVTAVFQHIGEELDDLIGQTGHDDTMASVTGRIVGLTERHGLAIGGVQMMLAVAVRRLADIAEQERYDADRRSAAVTRERFGA